MIGNQLQRQREDEVARPGPACPEGSAWPRSGCRKGCTLVIRDQDRASFAGDDLVHIRHGLFEGAVSRRDDEDRQVLVDECNWTVLEFSGGVTPQAWM